ncbi:MAG: hypothetical protein KJ063_07700 [Anaerolineae bacterium]|nr:hypothetical protein [Anaerolineae bacterium]
MNTTLVTKSIRLSASESAELAQLSAATSVSESALMKKWIQEGIQTQKTNLAVQAYAQRKVDLRGGAAMAGLSYNRFVQAVQAQNIIILDEANFGPRLVQLGEMFADPILQSAALVLLETPDE